jgi:hypothetical protein
MGNRERLSLKSRLRCERERNLSSIVKLIFAHDVADMDVHRALGDVPLVCNFLVSQTTSNQHDHFPLAWGGCSAFSEGRTHRQLHFRVRSEMILTGMG